MFKQLGLFVSCLLLSQATIATTAAPFTGIYGNMNFGWMNSNVEVDRSIDASILIPFTSMASADIRNNSITGGIGLGFAHSFKNLFIVGIEGRADFESLTTEFQNTTSTEVVATEYNSKSTAKLENDFALLFKIGVLLQPNTLIYGLIGPSWGYFNMFSGAQGTAVFTIPEVGTFNLTGSTSAREQGYQTGWLAGIGMEYLFSKNISAGLEYTHADYGKLNFPDHSTGTVGVITQPPIPGAFITNSAKFKSARTNNFLLKLNYYIS